jgi:hypothetical protein
LHECIGILNRCSRVNDEDLKSFELALENKSDTHSILFSLLALVLVANPREDVAAVTAYQTKQDGITVYFTKNHMSEGTINHVNKLKTLVQNTARDPQVTLPEFYQSFFEIVLPYCRGKIFRRLDDMRKRLDVTKKPDDIVNSTFDDLLEIYHRFQSDRTPPYKAKGNADKEAIRLSASNDLYDGLCEVLESVKMEAGCDLFNITSQDFVPLTAHAYIVGYASINTLIAKSSVNLVPLLRSFQKVGDYFRCATKLFRAITDSVLSRRRFAELKVVSIESIAPIERVLNMNWMLVLRCIWHRRTGRPFPITKGQWLANHSNGMALYEKYPKQKFVAHAELTLIKAIVENHRRLPTVIGVSKACCGFCTGFVDGVNQYREQTKLSTWHLPGSHGNCYVCQLPSVTKRSLLAGTAQLKEYLESKVVNLITESVPLFMSETPPQWSSSETSQDPNASIFPVKRRLSRDWDSRK